MSRVSPRIIFVTPARCGARFLHLAVSQTYPEESIALFYLPPPGPVRLSPSLYPQLDETFGGAEVLFTSALRPSPDVCEVWKGCCFSTIIREPISRAISDYEGHFAKYGLNQSQLPDYLKPLLETLDAYLDNELNKNYLTKFFSGLDLFEPATEEALKAAIDTVKSFDIILCLEYFNITALDLFIQRPELVTSSDFFSKPYTTNKQDNLDKNLLDKLHRANSFDMVLYKEVVHTALKKASRLPKSRFLDFWKSPDIAARMRIVNSLAP